MGQLGGLKHAFVVNQQRLTVLEKHVLKLKNGPLSQDETPQSPERSLTRLRWALFTNQKRLTALEKEVLKLKGGLPAQVEAPHTSASKNPPSTNKTKLKSPKLPQLKFPKLVPVGSTGFHRPGFLNSAAGPGYRRLNGRVLETGGSSASKVASMVKGSPKPPK